jgi:hypothetical protein
VYVLFSFRLPRNKINFSFDTCVISSGLSCGVFSGFIQSIVFNPYDRALYASILNQRPFLHRQNWVFGSQALVGVLPSILQRSLASGLYFPFEQIYRTFFTTRLGFSNGQADALSGLLAGATNGLVTAPINATKYALWREGGGGTNSSAVSVATKLVKNGNLMLAAPATITRDLIFGVVYSYLRHYRGDGKSGFFDNFTAGLVATFVSSPINYVRLKQYADPDTGKVSSAYSILRDLVKETRHRGAIDGLRYLVQNMNVGWGTLRVALGMGISSQLYTICIGRKNLVEK